MSYEEAKSEIARAALIGSVAALAGISVLVVVVSILTTGPMVTQPIWIMGGYLTTVAAISAWGGWMAGRVAESQPFVAAAFTAILLGAGGFVLGFLLTALVADPGWVGTATAGVAPAGALVGGLICWAGTDE